MILKITRQSLLFKVLGTSASDFIDGLPGAGVLRRKGKKSLRAARVYLFLWGYFLLVPLIALSPHTSINQYKLDLWQSELGFKYQSIYAVQQTRDGYIWLGTLGGLVRFDGIRFRVFNKDNTPGLKDNTIRSLYEDQQGTLWIGTSQGGLSYLKRGEFKSYTLQEYPMLKDISSIFQDRSGVLWFGTMDNGLTCLKDGKFCTYTVKDGLTSNRVRAFYEDETGVLWIATSVGLTTRAPLSGRFTAFMGKNGRFDKYIISMCRTKNGDFWLGCLDGLYCSKDGKINQYGSKENLPNPKIKCLCEDRDQNLWVGTEGGGLLRINRGKIETFSITDGLACGYVFSIHEDRDGNIWIGTLQGGLHRLQETNLAIYTTRNGLSSDVITSLFEDQSGDLWIGTQGGGVNRLHAGKLSLEFTLKREHPTDKITSILKNRIGQFWVGTESSLTLFKDGNIKNIKSNDEIFKEYIIDLLEDEKDSILILTNKNLKKFYKERTAAILNYKQGLNHQYQCCTIDHEGVFWIGTYEGGVIRLKGNEIISFTIQKGLAHNVVDCLYEDRDGVLYIGTRGGLSCRIGNKFVNLTTQNGLIDSSVRYIIEDNNNHLWIATRLGICCLDKKELTDFLKGKIDNVHPLIFDDSDGIKSPWSEKGIKTRDGKLWFATDKGLVMIDPANIKKNVIPPPVVIEKLNVDGEEVNVARGPVVIPPGKKRLEFDYTALSFIKPQKIKFKLKLLGYDDNWIDVGDARTTTYTRLAPGKYTFRVIACNADGVWNEQGASLDFYMQPYWYQTKWALLSFALLFVSGVFLFVKWRSRQLVKEKERLEQVVDDRTREIKDKNLQLEEQSGKLQEMDRIKSRFFANISHEFRTPLTLIMGPLQQWLSARPEKEQQEEMEMMLRNSQRLLTLINQLLDLSRLDSGKMPLAAAPQDIVPFLKGLMAAFASLAQKNDLQLVFGAEVESLVVFFDSEKLEKIFSNLLSNACKFTPAGGRIGLMVKSPGRDTVEIAVRDTGIGMDEEQLAHIFDRFYQVEGTGSRRFEGTGIGLSLVKELVELHRGTITVRSRVGEGSEFTVSLRLGPGHLLAGEIVEPVTGEITGSKEALEPVEAEGVEADPVEEVEEKKPGEKPIVLVVEDNADMRRFIKAPLKADYRVVEAADGREGIAMAREMVPDLIISDVMMPEVDGFELCAALKKDIKTSHIPIVLLTARASETSVIEGFKTGADDYITKPFNRKILATRIKNLIDLRRALQEKIQRELHLQPTEIAVSSIDQVFMGELKDVLDKNLSDPEFTVEVLAKKLYLSQSTLYRKVLALTGEAPIEFIRSYRLKRAAQLLKADFGNVTEVAFEVGFSSTAYFTKCFKEKFHRLPSAFQAAERGSGHVDR